MEILEYQLHGSSTMVQEVSGGRKKEDKVNKTEENLSKEQCVFLENQRCL